MAISIPGGYSDKRPTSVVDTNAVNADGSMKAGYDAVTGAPTGSAGTGDPQTTNYAGYRTAVGGGTMTTAADASAQLQSHIYDPWGPSTRPEGGREYQGAWVNPYNAANGMLSGNIPKYNQMLMTTAENFDPFMQRQEAENPHWWINRIPRRAYRLFDGLVHQTNLYRGGLSVYSGLGAWEDLQGDPTQADACLPPKFRTYQYAWETRAWSGKKTAWGSDPICLDIFKFTPHAIEQLGWILETGVKFGTDIQNIWNRDMFIYHSVMAGRSYIMSEEYRGTSSDRYVYEPFCKFVDSGFGDLKANKAVINKPFVVFSAEPSPVNFQSLQLLRRELERVCPDGAVGTIGSHKMYALGISADDLDNYIRGNEEERRAYLEGDPSALIKGWDIAPTTFRRWLITEDGDQLRFKFKKYIPNYSDEAENYGNVGIKLFAGKPVYIAEAVDPMRAGKPGINGAPIPEANPEYDLAELAIAPVFINHVYTNEFVPDVPGGTLGHGTYFGVVKGLNGKWAWYNIQTEQNPDNKIGNFRGIFEIVPRPENRAVYATSFLYRRCAQPLRSLCPAENVNISPMAKAETAVVKTAAKVSTGTYDLVLKTPLILAAGDSITVGGVACIVVSSPTQRKKQVVTASGTDASAIVDNATVEVVDRRGVVDAAEEPEASEE